MKKREKRNRRNANKIRGLKVGDSVHVTYTACDGADVWQEGVIDELGNGFVVVNHRIIEMYELISIRKT